LINFPPKDGSVDLLIDLPTQTIVEYKDDLGMEVEIEQVDKTHKYFDSMLE
jgi:hypothetical protein